MAWKFHFKPKKKMEKDLFLVNLTLIKDREHGIRPEALILHQGDEKLHWDVVNQDRGIF